MSALSTQRLPEFDDFGLNVADPADRLGIKSEYISLLQKRALTELVGRGQGYSLEIGCGYGRLTSLFAELGYNSIGLDPSLRLLRAAHRVDGDFELCAGALPNLPFRDSIFTAVSLLNVLRPLHLLGIKDACVDAVRLLRPGGRLIVLENIRSGDPRYVEEAWLVGTFEDRGLTLRKRVAIRSGRWPMIYAIRYGLVPRRLLPAVASWEIERMSDTRRSPRWTYHNVVFEFELGRNRQ